MPSLRPYQEEVFQATREAFRANRSVCVQMPTGSGKTILFSMMTKAAVERNNRAWIIVSRNELLKQSSAQLKNLGVKHGLIAVGNSESKAFQVHVVSKDTLIRRYEKIKRAPDFIIFDEVHLYIERQKEIVQRFPKAKILGVTATPERLDGRGLSEVYQTLIQGPSVADLVAGNYLTGVRYFCPPIEGIETLHRRGTEYDQTELQELLERRQVFGKAIEHYRKHADGLPCLVYCRSVKAAGITAQRFNDAGYRFENIDGRMTYKRRAMLIDALREGKIQGLTSCDLITYGLDVPRVSCIIMLRPTLSRALFSQMVGRGLRPWKGKKTCVILDHVNNLREHGHPLTAHEWQFRGREKRGKPKGDAVDSLKLCPACFLYFTGSRCDNCGTVRDKGQRRDLKEVDGRLVEVTGPVKIADREPEERREYVDRINSAVDRGAVADLLDIAKELGRRELWVYHRLNVDSEGQPKKMVNQTLLYEIARIKGYRPGWAWFASKKLKETQ